MEKETQKKKQRRKNVHMGIHKKTKNYQKKQKGEGKLPCQVYPHSFFLIDLFSL